MLPIGLQDIVAGDEEDQLVDEEQGNERVDELASDEDATPAQRKGKGKGKAKATATTAPTARKPRAPRKAASAKSHPKSKEVINTDDEERADQQLEEVARANERVAQLLAAAREKERAAEELEAAAREKERAAQELEAAAREKERAAQDLLDQQTGAANAKETKAAKRKQRAAATKAKKLAQQAAADQDHAADQEHADDMVVDAPTTPDGHSGRRKRARVELSPERVAIAHDRKVSLRGSKNKAKATNTGFLDAMASGSGRGQASGSDRGQASGSGRGGASGGSRSRRGV